MRTLVNCICYLALLILFWRPITIEANEVKAVIFDVDGTLVDSEYAHYLAWQHAMQEQGGDLSLDEYYAYVGKSVETNADLLAKRIPSGSPQKLLEDKRQYYSQLQGKGLPPILHVVDFVRRLWEHKEILGIKLGIASAAKRDEILINLRFLGIADFFDVILSGCDDLTEYDDVEGVNKPKPYIYLHVAKILGLCPSECVVIEDSFSGVKAGVDAGCITVAVPNAYTQNQDLSCANRQIKSFSDYNAKDFLLEVQNIR